MKRIIYAVMVLGVTFDAFAMNTCWDDAFQYRGDSEVRQQMMHKTCCKYGKLKAVSAKAQESMNSMLENLRQDQFLLLDQPVPVKCRELQKILNAQLAEAQYVVEQSEDYMDDLSVTAEVEQIRELWGRFSKGVISQGALEEFISRANTLKESLDQAKKILNLESVTTVAASMADVDQPVQQLTKVQFAQLMAAYNEFGGSFTSEQLRLLVDKQADSELIERAQEFIEEDLICRMSRVTIDDTQRETAEKIERVDSFFLDKGKIKIGEVYTFLRFLSEKNPWKMPLRDDIKRGLVQEFRSAFLCMEKMTAEKKLFINWILEISLSDYQQYKSERLGKIRELLANVSHKGVKKQFSDFIYGQMLQTEVGSAEQKCVMMLANVMKK